MNVALFAYGTLQIPEVMTRVTGRAFRAEDATLHGFTRCCIVGKSYPAALPRAGSSISGVLYHGLDIETLHRLDEFEDDYYRRQTLAVTTLSNVTVRAQVYLFDRRHYPMLVDAPWDLAEFRRQSLVRLLKLAEFPAPRQSADPI